MSEGPVIPNICVVGSSMVDLISRVPRLPLAGETLSGSAFSIGFGGKGSNQAVMAARLGARVSMVARLGRDVFGENTLQNYRDQGIDTTYVKFDDERFSGVAPIAVDENTGQNAIIVVPGANDGLSPAEVRAASPAIEEAAVLVCQLEIPVESTLEAFRIAKASGTVTILNPAPAARLPAELLRLSDVLVPNEVEAATLAGRVISTKEQAMEVVRELLERGPETVVITLGENGVIFVTADQPAKHVQVENVRAVDSTGAGDAFVGSLAYFLAAGYPLPTVVGLSCAIATRSVLRSGTQTSFPYREEVIELLG